MFVTVLLTLVIFVLFLSAVSLFYSFSAGRAFSPAATFAGAIVLAVLFMLIQYAISPWIIAASVGLRRLEPGQSPWLENTVRELAAKAAVAMPKLGLVQDATPNAFVFGNSSGNMMLAVHSGLIENLSEDEVKGVIGHELGHIRHRDSIIMTFLSAIPMIAYLVARATFGFRIGRDREEKGAGWIILAGVAALLVYFIAQLLVLRLSRLREHFADAFSAYLTREPRNLESALTKITYGLSLSQSDTTGARALYISDPSLAKEEIGSILEHKSRYDLDRNGVLDERELELAMESEAKTRWGGFNELFSTHPPTYKRLLLLRQIENEISSTGMQPQLADVYKRI